MFGYIPLIEEYPYAIRIPVDPDHPTTFFWVAHERKKVHAFMELRHLIDNWPRDAKNPYLIMVRDIGNRSKNNPFISYHYRLKRMYSAMKKFRVLYKRTPNMLPRGNLYEITVNLPPVPDMAKTLENVRAMEGFLRNFFHRSERELHGDTWWCEGAIWRIETAPTGVREHMEVVLQGHRVHAHTAVRCSAMPDHGFLFNLWRECVGQEFAARLKPSDVHICHLLRGKHRSQHPLQRIKSLLRYACKDPLLKNKKLRRTYKFSFNWRKLRDKDHDLIGSVILMLNAYHTDRFAKIFKAKKTGVPFKPIHWIGRCGAFDGRGKFRGKGSQAF